MGLFNFKKSILETGILQGGTDRHSHILYSVDDGVPTLEESLKCLQFYENCGLSDLWLTPHVMEDIPNSTARLRARFDELVSVYVHEEESLTGKVRLHLAAEYMLDGEFEKRLSAHDLLTMEDDMVLVETSSWSGPAGMKDLLRRIMSEGYRPLLAHVERYHYMNPQDYDELHEMGVIMQANFGSFVGAYGPNSRKRAKILMDKGYYSFLGSDCHRFRNLESNCSKKEFGKDAIASLSALLHR